MPKAVCTCGGIIEFREGDTSAKCSKCGKTKTIRRIRPGVFLLR
ncbi:MAG: hypothetical protein ACXQTI_08795 [Candidatus Nezhaarchaeales archaeon]